MATSAVKKIVVQIALQGKEVIDAVKKGFSETNKELEKTNKTLGKLGTMLKTAIGIHIIRQAVGYLTDLADSYQLAADRISIFVGGSEKARTVMDDLTRIANDNKTSLENASTTYTRLSMAMSDVGISSEQLLAVTDLLTKTFRLSGSTSSEATASVIQLSQGLASGQLRGQEMRSVLEQNAVMGEILAKSFGKTRGELMKLAESGFFTTERVLTALAKSQDKVNKDASNLRTTFGQLGDVIKNDLVNSFGKLISDMQIPDKILKGYEFLREHIVEVSIAVGILGAALGKYLLGGIMGKVVAIIGSMLAGLTALKAAAILAAAAVVAVGVNMLRNWERTKLQTSRLWESMKVGAMEFAKDMLSALSHIPFMGDITASAMEKMSKKIAESRLQISEYDKALEALTTKEGPKKLEPIAIPKSKGGLRTLEQLNMLLKNNSISLMEYNDGISKLKLEELNKKFQSGAMDIYAFNEELRRLDVDQVARGFEAGYISLDEFNRRTRENKLEELSLKLRKAKISVAEYYTEVNKLNDSFSFQDTAKQAMASFVENIGTTNSQMASLFENTFNKMGDSIVEFAKTGKFAFKDFAYELIDDMSKIIVKTMILKPLLAGIMGGMGGGPSTAIAMNYSAGSVGYAAKGFAPDGTGVSKFAKGGVINSPTPFTFDGGKKGLAGEAGPEAIIPLTRGSDGKLGVEAQGMGVVVNIINNTDNQITQSESTGPNGEQMLDIMISAKVKEGFAKGTYDSAMSNNYGIKRRGR